MSGDRAVRAAILDAAVRILQESGAKALTQPKVAHAAGVRQSHLTYYFPKRHDLIAALLQQHLDHTNGDDDNAGGFDAALRMVADDPKRMRFFLGLLVEAQHDEAFKALIVAHVAEFDARVAAHYGRQAGDVDVTAFLNCLRGYGICGLLDDGATPQVDIAALAKRFGLRPRKPHKPRTPSKTATGAVAATSNNNHNDKDT